MLPPIQLDHKHAASADEVADVAADRDLATELMSSEAAAAQLQPEQALTVGGAVAQLLGLFGRRLYGSAIPTP